MAISDAAVQIAPEVNQFISSPHKMLIDGRGREMGHEVLNNYTEVKAVTIAL